MEESMFTTLLSLPLFQGLGYEDVTRIVESTRLEFSTLHPGELLCKQDAVCDAVHIGISGRLGVRTLSADRSWAVEEDLPEHGVVGLDVLYGRRRTYANTYTALEPTRLVTIDKHTIGALFRFFEVMQMSAFNMLTTEIAQRDRLLWLPPAQTLVDRIKHFMLCHVLRPAGRKRFKISMALLGQYLSEDQRRISKALHSMADEGLVQLYRRAVAIDSFERLLNG
ncbi:MAG: Crp/Fnr family transcriptional regulator [Bacteroidaceae bacterium]|nr:Crp/Fnr family transcriptional regulator [Bacteroidaceae bacterium]